MKQLLSLIVFVCCSLSAAAGVYNVRDYGAKGDGKTLDWSTSNTVNRAPTIQNRSLQGGHRHTVSMPATWKVCTSTMSPSVTSVPTTAPPLCSTTCVTPP